MDISVVIPTKNGYPEIKYCIEGILSQSIQVREILVIDSGSTDGTVEYLNSIPQVKLIKIEPDQFNHGDTRNKGWENCSSEFLVYTVQDAKPVDTNWLAELMKGFVDDFVAGVCGQQVVDNDKNKNPVEWFRPIGVPRIIKYTIKTPLDFETLPAENKKIMCSWDNVNAIYRRLALENVPFNRVVFGEDMAWAKDALLAGYSIVYNYAARVHHYHKEDSDFVFKRNFTTMYFDYRQFGYVRPIPSLNLKKQLGILKTLITNLGIDIKEIWRWYHYNTMLLRSLKASHKLFLATLIQGEDVLDRRHTELCGKPPIPLKAK